MTDWDCNPRDMQEYESRHNEEPELDFFDDDIMQIFDKYIAKGFVSDDGYLFFEDKALEEKFTLAVDMLKELIKHTHKENNNA